MYAGCHIVWASKLQMVIALSSTKADYVSLLKSIRYLIPLMGLFKEIKRSVLKSFFIVTDWALKVI